MRHFITLVLTLEVIINYFEISSASPSSPKTRDFITNFGMSSQHSDDKDTAVTAYHPQPPFVHQFTIRLPCEFLIAIKGSRRPFWKGTLNAGETPSWMLNQYEPHNSEENVYAVIPYGSYIYHFTGKAHNLDMGEHSHPVSISKVVLKCANGNFISRLSRTYGENPQDAFASLHVRLSDGILHGGLDTM